LKIKIAKNATIVPSRQPADGSARRVEIFALTGPDDRIGSVLIAVIRPSLNRFVHIMNRSVRRVDDLRDHTVGHVDLARLFRVGCNGPDVQCGANHSAVAQDYLRHAMTDAANSGASTRTDPKGKRLEISEPH
jgi:hypothetical protein